MIEEIFHVLALLIIMAVSICRLNLMTRETRFSIKLSYIALAGGAFSEVLAILCSATSGWFHALLVAGIAGVLVGERRNQKCYQFLDCA